MKKSTKIGAGILVGIGVLAISLLFLNSYLESRIKKGIEENLKKANATFEKVDVKLLGRTAEISNPEINIRGKSLKVEAIKLNDIQIWDYITSKDIIVGNLNISKPVIKVYDLQKKEKDSSKNKKSSGFDSDILIKQVNIDKGSLQILEKDSSAHRFYTKINKVKLDRVRINKQSLKETVPFDYELILLNVDSIFYDLDAQHEMVAGDLVIDNNNVQITDFKIIPKFSKTGHQKSIKVEKDRYELAIDSISMDRFIWTVQNDSLKIQNSFTGITGVNFQIYRDKLQPDDTTFKPLYSRMLRELPILLQLDSIRVKQAYIKYEENIHEDREAGIVEFSNLNASIRNLTNIGMNSDDFPKTMVKANTDFMKTAPLSVNWEFDISDRNDRFHFSGQMGRLAAEQMNKFLKPAMNIEAKGEVLNMYFNFHGNNTKANGDMRLEYKDFKVEVLRKDGNRKNDIISALANLIVKNKALNEKANYKEISFIRNKTKSFWNYVWNLVKNGALKAFL